MTMVAATRATMANGHLFQSKLGLYEFQAEAVAHAYLREQLIAVMDLGLGKSVVALALAASLIEDGQIDQVVLVARKNKLLPSEFPADFAEFTSLRAHLYAGDGRGRRLAKAQAAGPIDVIMVTYETAKLDLMTRVKGSGRGKGRKTDGPLFESLQLRSKRTLWVYDEVGRLGHRSSELYQAHEYALAQQRAAHGSVRVLALSATPMSTDYEQSFNIGRIVAPHMMPSVTDFETRFSYGRDQYQRLSFRASAKTEFAPLFERLIYRKRASDDDVVHQYPRLIEKLVLVDLEPQHRALYEATSDLFGDDWDELSEEQLGQVRTALRLTLGHPRAHLRSQSELSVAITSALGADTLAAIPSSKTRRLIEDLRGLIEAGKRILVFTFFAETILPELAIDLRAAGFKLAVYTSSQSTADNERAKADFKVGAVDVLLSSDAGAEGLNLPEADVIIEYESAHTFERRSQRFGRGTRITSQKSFIYAQTLVCRGTLDVAQVRKVLRRNDLQDHLLGDVGAKGHKDANTRKYQLMSGM